MKDLFQRHIKSNVYEFTFYLKKTILTHYDIVSSGLEPVSYNSKMERNKITYQLNLLLDFKLIV